MPYESQRDRIQLPLATDTERLVATLMSPQVNILRKLAVAERLYTLIPTYTWRMLTTSAINLLGRDALLDNGGSEYEAKRQLYANTLISMLRFMDKSELSKPIDYDKGSESD